MRITSIRETAAPISSEIANAYIDFSKMTCSLVAVTTDLVRDGRPVTGFGFSSNGRYAAGAIMRDRMIPRLLEAAPDTLLDPANGLLDPFRCWDRMMTNEKPGGHGERAGAVGVLDMALWDLRARQRGEPAWRTIADYFGRPGDPRVFAYASGGHYRDLGDEARDRAALADEVRGAMELGHTQYKIKVGGAPLDTDRRRIDAALAALGPGCRLAVDANSVFGRDAALAFLDELDGGYVVKTDGLAA
ncbi:MAG: mandelate racemase, partial [Geminicoccaceae bacterium]|nr:mandelate racemase [Geminicoccaceae bacterium]